MNITEHLINYRFYQANIKALEEAIKIDRLTSDGLRATDYSRDNISTSEISNITENTAIHILTKENDLKKQRLLVDSIDRAIKELEDIDKQIIQLKYMQQSSFNVSWEQVAKKTGYDVRQCQRRRDKALEKISIVLCGVI